MQIEAVLVLSNGDIAISGGPRRFEILIYRHNYLCERGRKDGLVLVDSLDTGVRRTIQMLEAQLKFLIVAQADGSFLIFLRDESQSSPDPRTI